MFSSNANVRPQPLFILTFRNRSVAAFRDYYHTLEEVIKHARATFPTLESVPVGDVVVLATLPQDPSAGSVEVSHGIWPVIQPVVSRVAIALRAERLQLEAPLVAGI
ncbi:hypothetical protein BC827DRAFT_34079 [Russula dissimulans]|nr:hypothetical protein BC827DRAFT_34079 [Russula dissimulans]